MAVQSFLAHPAPGIVFEPHDGAHVPERAYATPHQSGKRTFWWQRRQFTSLTRSHSERFEGMRSVYRKYNGLSLCHMKDPLYKREVPALRILPLAAWDEATQPWKSGDLAPFLNGCDIYNQATWRVFGTLSSESQCLVIFFDGEMDGRPLAGNIFCIGLDGCLGFEEVLANSFDEFLIEFTTNPIAIFEKVGFTWAVADNQGRYYGDVAGKYVPDVRTHPKYANWPA